MQKKREWTTHNYMNTYHKHTVEWMKPDTKVDSLCDSTYAQFKFRQNLPNMVLEVRILLTLEGPEVDLGCYDYM